VSFPLDSGSCHSSFDDLGALRLTLRGVFHSGRAAMLSFNMRSNVDAFARQFRAKKEAAARATRDALRKSRPLTDNVLAVETRAAFRVRDQRMLKSWRTAVPRGELKLIIMNLMRGFALHAEGGTIAPRNQRVLLIPINTRMGTRISSKKFYKMIDWLRREKLTVVRNNILYVKPPMNTSNRGGVAAGTRVNKRFRSRFQGTKRRPSGFDIQLNEHGLTPIAIMRRSVGMRKRFDMPRIVKTKVLPIVLRELAEQMRKV
jgi:hypothetical protein